ncbi:MAG: transcriptional repressor [Thermodesulfobacteriota bacterium]
MQQPIHKQEAEQFARLFEEAGIDRVPDRLSVLETFLQTEDHVTAGELSAFLAKAGKDFDPAFVRETLRLACHYGFAQRYEFSSREPVYEHRHLSPDHHDHMVCVKCGKITEFMDERLERLQAEAAARQGFYLLQHRMEMYGLCEACMADRRQEMPLSSARPGEDVAVARLAGGAGVRQRLLAMGLRPGDRLCVITNDGQGQVVVAAEGRRYGLGRGLADKILVAVEGKEACTPALPEKSSKG